MKNNLVILSNTYPDSIFIENELKNFDDIENLFVFQNKMGEFKEIENYDLPCIKNIKYFISDYDLESKNRLKKYFCRFLQVFKKDFWKEVTDNRRNIFNGHFPNNFLILTSYLYNSKKHAKDIYDKLRSIGISKEDRLIFYAFRMHFHLGSLYYLKKKFTNARFIARGHGYDLFQYRWDYKYIPMQARCLKEMDLVLAISEHGRKYIVEEYKLEKEKVFLNYLGKEDYGLGKYEKSSCLRLVSCSRMDPIKRLDRIISTLSLTNLPIEWTHIGGGKGLSDLISKASKLPDNIKTNFLGMKTNEEVLSIYKNMPFDLFINVSEEEGLPVSIMEASSFGVPSIATDVGGTSEIVNKKTGFLISKDFNDSDLLKIIETYYNLSEKGKMEYRNFARNTFLKKFNSQVNSKILSNKINKL